MITHRTVAGPLRRTLDDGARAAAALLGVLRDQPGPRAAALLLFAALAGFVSIHVLALAGPALGSQTLTDLRGGPWMLTRDRSWSEAWECLLLCGTAAAMAVCLLRLHAPAFAALAAVNLWLAADNWIGIHEAAGLHLGWRGISGELIFFLITGSLLGLATLWALARTRPPERALALPALACLAGVAVCAVAVDAVHAAGAERWGWGWKTEKLLGLLEDGGEFLFITLGAAAALALLRLTAPRPDAPPRAPAAPR